jgi:hypothetical protein
LENRQNQPPHPSQTSFLALQNQLYLLQYPVQTQALKTHCKPSVLVALAMRLPTKTLSALFKVRWAKPVAVKARAYPATKVLAQEKEKRAQGRVLGKKVRVKALVVKERVLGRVLALGLEKVVRQKPNCRSQAQTLFPRLQQ